MRTSGGEAWRSGTVSLSCTRQTVAASEMADDQRFAHLTTLACHELRTPLATVSGFARTLARLELADPAGEYVKMIEAAAAQIRELLEQLAIVARIETGRFDPVFGDVDSLELARAAAEELGEERVLVSGDRKSVV